MSSVPATSAPAPILSEAINPYNILDNPKSIILRLLLPILINLKCDKYVLLKTIWTISAVISLNSILDKSDNVFKYLWSGITKILYTTIKFDAKHNIERYILDYLHRKSELQLLKRGITFSKDEMIISRLKRTQVMDFLKLKAQKLRDAEDDLLNSTCAQILKYDLSNKLVEIQPKALFESHNYKRLGHSIKTFIKITNKTKNYSVLPVLANGIPGLGKTNFCSYLASQKIVDKIIYIELNLFDKPYETLFNALIPKDINHNTLVMFDEVDKYIDELIRREYDREFKKKSSKPVKLDEVPEVELSEEDELKRYKKFSIQFRQTFLINLLKYMSVELISGSLIIMFCANNFNTLFDGIDMTHFKSLDDRLIKFKFELCPKVEIIEYMSFYMEKCSDMDIYVEKDEYLKLLNQYLNHNVHVTYRQLFYICLQHSYQPIETAKEINQWYSNYVANNGLENNKINYVVPLKKRGAEFYFIKLPIFDEDEYSKQLNLYKMFESEVTDENVVEKILEYHQKSQLMFGNFIYRDKINALFTPYKFKYYNQTYHTLIDFALSDMDINSSLLADEIITKHSDNFDLLSNEIQISTLNNLIAQHGLDKCLKYGLNLNYLPYEKDILRNIKDKSLSETIEWLDLLFEHNYDFSDDANFFNLYDYLTIFNYSDLESWMHSHSINMTNSIFYKTLTNNYKNIYEAYYTNNRYISCMTLYKNELIEMSKIPGISLRFKQLVEHYYIDNRLTV